MSDIDEEDLERKDFWKFFKELSAEEAKKIPTSRLIELRIGLAIEQSMYRDPYNVASKASKILNAEIDRRVPIPE